MTLENEILFLFGNGLVFIFREITMASLRRLLEEDLKLKKDSLVPFKKFINKELDDVSRLN